MGSRRKPTGTEVDGRRKMTPPAACNKAKQNHWGRKSPPPAETKLRSLMSVQYHWETCLLGKPTMGSQSTGNLRWRSGKMERVQHLYLMVLELMLVLGTAVLMPAWIWSQGPSVQGCPILVATTFDMDDCIITVTFSSLIFNSLWDLQQYCHWARYRKISFTAGDGL